MARVTQLQIFPIKALDPVAVTSAVIAPGGSFKWDRQWALFDESGHFINGKRFAGVHGIRADFDAAMVRVTLRLGSETASFDLQNTDPLTHWLGQVWGMPVYLRQDLEHGFPDDLNAPGPTIISTATLQMMTEWFPRLTLIQARARFRTNIEVDEVPVFWEDQLFKTAEQVVQFRVGGVLVEGVNPCARCVVPTRDPWTGEVIPGFQKQFVDRRRAELPEWTERSRFNHFYRLAINTRVPASEAGKVIRVGDPIEMIGAVVA